MRARPSAARAHAALERLLVRAMVAPDPLAVLQRAARDRRLPAPLRELLAAVDADGLRLTALLVLRLRFERLLRGCPEAEALFDADPQGFAERFRRYHQSTPLTAFFPQAEAALFRGFLAAETGAPGSGKLRRSRGRSRSG
jgi:hypothetical protein